MLIFLALNLILSQETKQCLVMKGEKYFELEDDSQQAIKTLENTIIRLSINLYRASVFTITSVAIIAVDFKIFARIHAKTSEFGISLMDLGVGKNCL